MDRKRAPTRRQPPRAAKRTNNASGTDGSTPSFLRDLPVLFEDEIESPRSRKKFDLPSVLGNNVLFPAIIKKMDFVSIATLLQTCSSAKDRLLLFRSSIQPVPKSYGHLMISQDANQPFTFRTFIRALNIDFVLNPEYFPFELIWFTTTISHSFFVDHVKDKMFVIGNGTKNVVIWERLSDDVLREIFNFIRPESVRCWLSSTDVENTVFQDVPIMDIVCGETLPVDYRSGAKIIDLLGRHRELRFCCSWQIRREVFHNLIELWLGGADIADDKRIILLRSWVRAVDLSLERHELLARHFGQKYKDATHRLTRNHANSSNVLCLEVDEQYNNLQITFKTNPETL